MLRSGEIGDPGLPSLVGDGDKGIEIVYDEKNVFCTGPTRAAKAEQKFVYRHDKTNKPTKEGPFSCVLFDSPFATVSTVSRATPL